MAKMENGTKYAFIGEWLKWLGFSFKNKKIIVKDVELLYFYKKIHRVSKDIQPILGDIGPIWTTEIS